MENICDVVRLACFGNGRRRDGPHQIRWTGIWDKECDDWVGCDGGGGQEREGGGNGTTSQVEKVGFLRGVRYRRKGFNLLREPHQPDEKTTPDLCHRDMG